MPRSRRAENVDGAFLRRWPLPRIDPKGGKESRGTVLDAEALACASVEPRAMASASTEIAVTPHAREMAKMLEIDPAEVTRNPAAIAIQAARALKAIVALKGSETFIASPSGRLLCNRLAGNAGLGTSGSGDALAGIAPGLATPRAGLLQAPARAGFFPGPARDAPPRKGGPV